MSREKRRKRVATGECQRDGFKMNDKLTSGVLTFSIIPHVLVILNSTVSIRCHCDIILERDAGFSSAIPT